MAGYIVPEHEMRQFVLAYNSAVKPTLPAVSSSDPANKPAPTPDGSPVVSPGRARKVALFVVLGLVLAMVLATVVYLGFRRPKKPPEP